MALVTRKETYLFICVSCGVLPLALLLCYFLNINFFEGTIIEEWWKLVMIDLSDKRTNNWPLITNLVPLFAFVFLWLGFVTAWGPKMMESRKPLKMTKLLIAYNAIQVVISVYITWQALYHGYIKGVYSLRCEPVDPTRSPSAMRAARSFYFYFLAKLTELLDTVFFVLRKKDNQVSFLHIYHHFGMPFISWGLTKYYPGGHFAFAGMLNSMVHVVMYTYYMIAAMGPEYQKYLWWKKYITSMQMLQFTLAFIHFSQLFFFDCGFPRWTLLFAMPNAVFFFIMFNDFYQKAYKARKVKEDALLLKASNEASEKHNIKSVKEKVT